MFAIEVIPETSMRGDWSALTKLRVGMLGAGRNLQIEIDRSMDQPRKGARQE